MKHLGTSLVFAVMALLAAGCGGAGDEVEEESFVVPPDKTDNFLSLTAQEYQLEGTSTVTIESYLQSEPEEVKIERVHELISLKQIVIGWFLNAYLGPDEEDSSKGFDCLTKNGSYEDMGIKPLEDGLTYAFTFRQEIGGTLDLLSKLPTTVGEDGRRYFDLLIGKVSNEEMAQLETNHEWYRSYKWSNFDPGKADPDQVETVHLAIWPEPRSPDAWIDYRALFADGEVTIGVHFGWDYHGDYHLKHSRQIYDWLVGQGYRSPVDSYDDYTHTSGPLTRTIKADGRPVVVKIWLFWGKPGTVTDPDTDAGGRVLEDDMRESFRSREVILYSGHSGPFYGFALANWRKTDEGDLDDSEIPTLDMPADTYQVVLADGCETYALGQAFWDNPSKADRTHLDILTTTSFSNAAAPYSIKDFIDAIAGTDYSGEHEARLYGELLRDLDGNSYWFNTMYGIHGLDDNPHLHPYADERMFCQGCGRDSDCGQAYKCARLNNQEDKACFALCTADDGCPEGWKCMNVASGYTMQWKACVPNNLSCTQEPEPVTRPSLMLNEVLADPPPDSAGDANRDGRRDASQDEFVEIVNYGTQRINLSGWAIADATGTRFVFPAGTGIPAGQALVVFGGGTPAESIGNSPVLVTGSMLGLNNGGDTVALLAPDGNVVDQLHYDRALGGQDCSMVRATDGDPTAAWILHSTLGSPFSAGTRSDGTSF